MTLKERRLARGLTQVQAAILCGVAASTYRLWEYGVPPNEENKQKLEEALSDDPVHGEEPKG